MKCYSALEGCKVSARSISQTPRFFLRSMFNTLTKQLFTGGMGLTMAKVREHYWILRLRRLVKVIRQCCLQPHPQVYCR